MGFRSVGRRTGGIGLAEMSVVLPYACEAKKSTRGALLVSVPPWCQQPVCINSHPFHTSFHLSISVAQTDIIHVTFYSIITLPVESSRIWFPLLKSPISKREKRYFFPILETFRCALTTFDIRNTSQGRGF